MKSEKTIIGKLYASAFVWWSPIFLTYHSLHKCKVKFNIKYALSYHDGLWDAKTFPEPA